MDRRTIFFSCFRPCQISGNASQHVLTRAKKMSSLNNACFFFFSLPASFIAAGSSLRSTPRNLDTNLDIISWRQPQFQRQRQQQQQNLPSTTTTTTTTTTSTHFTHIHINPCPAKCQSRDWEHDCNNHNNNINKKFSWTLEQRLPIQSAGFTGAGPLRELGECGKLGKGLKCS